MRTKNFPELPSVAAFQVAPHRYLWDYPCITEELLSLSWREVRDAAPYKAGEVVYVVDGDGGYRRAYIARVDACHDAYGDWRECYWVRPETKGGTFAKREYKAHPGFVQRGYQRALGLNYMDQPQRDAA